MRGNREIKIRITFYVGTKQNRQIKIIIFLDVWMNAAVDEKKSLP